MWGVSGRRAGAPAAAAASISAGAATAVAGATRARTAANAISRWCRANARMHSILSGSSLVVEMGARARPASTLQDEVDDALAQLLVDGLAGEQKPAVQRRDQGLQE